MVLPILDIVFFVLFLLWANKKWTHLYFIDDSCVEIVPYQDKNVFRTPLRKVIRAKRWSKDDYDIFLYYEHNRFLKTVHYKLVDMDDEDIKIIKQKLNNELH